MIDFVKATLETGQPILLNELKINCIWIEKSNEGKELCFIGMEDGNKIAVKPALFYNWMKKEVKE